MKIDKVVFSSSELFSVFWNLNSKIFRTKLGIEPVCLLFGKKSNTDMTEEFGKVIEMPILGNLPLLIQITWSKFWWPTQEPETTWLINDIDLLPLNARWFTQNIEHVPEDHYVHLDADGITQLSRTKYTWTGRELNAKNMPDYGHDTNMPGHYHCGKGRVIKEALGQHGSMEHEIRRLMDSGFRNVRGFREDDPIEQHGLWCAEENWSTKQVRRSLIEGRIKFSPFSLPHGIDRITGDRLDKSMYDGGEGHYRFDPERLKNGEYADLHCIRPFRHFLSEEECAKRWKATKNVLRIAGMIDEPVAPPVIENPDAEKFPVDTSASVFADTWKGGYVETNEGYLLYNETRVPLEVARVGINPFRDPDATVMEIGCGRGVWTRDYLSPSFKRVITLDVIPRSDWLLELPNVEHIQVADRDFTCAGVADDSVDFVWSFGCFCHLSADAVAAYLKSAFRKMKPGAHAVCMFANWNRHPELKDSDGSRFKNTRQGDGTIWFYSDLDIVRESVADAGFVDFVDLIPDFRDTLASFRKP